ncbi:phytanoyl-CoA dioxygenase family protein [Ruegeria sp. HKCCA6837]|uniref:phytanoyl-CoA dioxygenase family protein n=1 Tax=Ruegeria sp. HKCCA6837 TaxID=2682989 RepID=UPI00148857EF|nr:phytanoyl-CoA dioxygenase family protein [Ruegeria sp. HKCCA6837]
MGVNQRVRTWANAYNRDGYVGGVPILTEVEAQEHRAALEWAESQLGASMHYKSKAHTILTSPYKLATHPLMLDLIEALIGPDILLYNVTYIIKEPGSTSHVSWHQDLTYWGLSHDDQVSAWLALSPADEESGCMRMLPGSHANGVISHETTEDDDNVLLQGQTVLGVDESQAKLCPLRPGEASFHHGWTLHASMPNKSKDRRIGLNIQYLAAHVRQTKHDLDTAMLVRGEDNFGHFGIDTPAESDLDPVAVQRQIELEQRHVEIAGTA